MATPLDIGILEPIFTNIQGMFGTLKYLIGGVFGVYIILAIIRYFEYRMLKKTLKEIKHESVRTNELLKRIEHTMEIKVRKG